MDMNRLKELRIKHGLNQKEVADALDTTQQAISLYESGKREPKLKTWQKLADYFNVSTRYLMGLNSNDFGNRIKELRIKNGLSQGDLAKATGLTRQAISNYERGDREPRMEIWQKLANALNTSVVYARGDIDTELIAKIAKMAFCLLEPSLNVELGEKALPEKGKKGCIGLLLIALINQLGLNTEDIIKELSLKMEGSDFASMINNDDVEGLTEAGLKLANIYDEI